MSMRGRDRSVFLLGGLLLLLAGLGAGDAMGTETVADGEGLRLVDRLVAIVNEETILLSDLERMIGLGLVERRPGESDRDLLRRALDELIEHRLRLQEIERFGPSRPPLREVSRQVEEIRSRFASEEEFQDRLRELGLDEDGLRHLIGQQLAVLGYLEERLGPRVFVGEEEIEEYYRNRLRPELEAAGAEVPPLDEIRERIRHVVREQLLNHEVERWTRELRRRADVMDVLDGAEEDLPPIIDSY